MAKDKNPSFAERKKEEAEKDAQVKETMKRREKNVRIESTLARDEGCV